MKTSSNHLLADELTKQLSERQFYSVKDLHALGLFETKYAARKAINSGKMAYIRLSARRRVIPSASLITYVLKNLSEIEP